MFSRPIDIVNAVSIDADNCLLNKYYNDLSDPESVINANKILTEYLKTRLTVGPSIENIILPGSLRQSDEEDKFNSKNNKTNSFFLELVRYKSHLDLHIKKLKLHKYLLADVNTPGPIGYSFDKALGLIVDDKPHPRCIGDMSKIGLMYLQMHRIAAQFPNATISFDFMDDNISMLEKLEQFYEKHPELMPNNATFNSHEYRGDILKLRKSIIGAGPIDYKYEDGFLDMMTAVSKKNRTEIYCVKYHKIPEKLNVEAFKIKRGLDYSIKNDVHCDEKAEPVAPARVSYG